MLWIMKTPFLNKRNVQIADLESHYTVPKSTYYLVYAPLAGLYFLSDSDTVLRLEREAENSGMYPEMSDLLNELSQNTEEYESRIVRDPRYFVSMSILPNFICNLHCAYCYSAKGRSNLQIDQKVLTSALNFFIDPSRISGRNLSLFISGGGEPLVSFDTVRFAIDYSRKRAIEKGFMLDIMLMTNATLVTPKIAGELKKQNVNVGVSFEILKDIQNLQRGKYDIVDENLRTLLNAEVAPSISSVITPNNVNRMDEMIDIVIDRYQGVRHLNFDPAMSGDLFKNTQELDVFYDDFLRSFFKAKSKCTQHGITLDCNVIRKAEKIFPRYCQGKIALTPEGKFSICHSISSPLESAYNNAIYGEISPDGSVFFDLKKFSDLIDPKNFLLPQCEECIARWHCSGGCMMYRGNYDNERFGAVCRFTAKAIVEILLRRLNLSYQKEENTDIETLLNANKKIV